jgi:pyrimidine deaminase RibD-like protein
VTISCIHAAGDENPRVAAVVWADERPESMGISADEQRTGDALAHRYLVLMARWIAATCVSLKALSRLDPCARRSQNTTFCSAMPSPSRGPAS